MVRVYDIIKPKGNPEPASEAPFVYFFRYSPCFTC